MNMARPMSGSPRQWNRTRIAAGLSTALLEQAYGLDQKQFRAWFGSGRPTAKRYHDAIEEQNGFRHIEHVQEMRPGFARC